MKNFLLGLIIVGVGFGISYYAANLREMFGRSEWLERNLGSTTGGYMIFGLGVMIIGFLIMFGILSSGSTQTVSELHMSSQPQ